MPVVDILTPLEPNSRSCLPFLKWAGGKRWLVEAYSWIFPKEFNRYIEPFIGSGAVFFSLCPAECLLADLNSDLIAAYLAVRDFPDQVYAKLRRHHHAHSFDYYYEIRDLKPRSEIGRAAKFIYLNRTCFNGIYRVNLRGEFNVPVGSKKQVVLETDDFTRASDILRKAELECQDFEVTIDKAMQGDFVFVDPPYTVAHNKNGFIKYNQTIFSWDDQQRLQRCLVRASDRGAKFLLLNANHESIQSLYSSFRQRSLPRHSVIAAASKDRRLIDELAISNYLPNEPRRT
jgi:DNA adenine methylase